MKTTIDTRFFRAGVGTVIYNKRGGVALFERAKNPIGAWQFQQGGIDLDEDLETTLWRELKEEVGLDKADVDSVMEMPEWTVHVTESSLSDASKSRFGQAHKWFFIGLAEGVEIDLSTATDDEASDFRWTNFADAIDHTESLKKHVYQKLETYFDTKIRPAI
jgi:putative (di)nucleoside polyphosphate hydrolase